MHACLSELAGQMRDVLPIHAIPAVSNEDAGYRKKKGSATCLMQFV